MQDIALSGYFPVNNFSSLFTVFPHEEVKKKKVIIKELEMISWELMALGWVVRVDWARKGGLDKEAKGRHQRRGWGLWGEGAACFEVSPRWPEEVKSHVDLQVNVQNKGHLLPKGSSRTPCSWTTAWNMLVKNIAFKILKGVKSSRLRLLQRVNLCKSHAKRTWMSNFMLCLF